MHFAPELIEVEDYEWAGKTYRIELMRRVQSVPTFFAYVSDAAGNVAQTADKDRLDVARHAARRQARQDRPGSPKKRANGPMPHPVPEDRAAAILAFVAANPRAETARVAEAIRETFATARKSLRKMVADGRLSVEVTKVNNWSRERWSVACEVAS